VNGDLGLDAFARLVAALEPWLGQFVIIGGWAHRLYRMHPHAQALDYQPLMTLDTDIAVTPKLPAGEQEIRERLVAQGFSEQLLGDDRPPATHYHLSGEETGFCAEFLTPLTGSDYDRRHKRKATIGIGGIVSQQLRHIELLLYNPCSVDLQTAERAVRIQIANPVSFLAQKVLIHRNARPLG